MWFRNDLRVHDNDALLEASTDEYCLPIFILDEGYLKLQTTSEFHLSFLNDSLKDLNKNLLKIFNAKLNIYEGKTQQILYHLINKYKIVSIYSHKIFKGKYFNELDKNLGLFFKENAV